MLSAVIKDPGIVELEETNLPSLRQGQMLLRLKSVLTSLADVENVLQGNKSFPLGSYFSGCLDQVSPEIESQIPGKDLMLANSASCGKCHYCLKGQENLCQMFACNSSLGALAEFVKVKAAACINNIFAKPDNVSFTQAAFMPLIAEVLLGLRKIPPEEDGSLVVLGATGYGLISLLLLKSPACLALLQPESLHEFVDNDWINKTNNNLTQNASTILNIPNVPTKECDKPILTKGNSLPKIIVADTDPGLLELAKKLGADAIVNPEKENLQDFVMKETGGYGAQLVIESSTCLRDDTYLLGSKGSSILTFGKNAKTSNWDVVTTRLHYDQITAFGSANYSASDVLLAKIILENHFINPENIIFESCNLGEIQKAFNQLREHPNRQLEFTFA